MSAHASSALTGHIGALLAHVKSLHHELLKLSKAGPVTAEQILPFQEHLRTIESHKHDGVWCGNLSQGQVPHGQAQVQEQFQETMDLVQSLLEAAESAAPVAAAAAPADAAAPAAAAPAAEAVSLLAAVEMQVQEVNNELTRMKSEGNVNVAALLPFQRLLRSIEELKQNGVWCGKLKAGVVPEGQARLNDLFEATSELAASMAADDEE